MKNRSQCSQIISAIFHSSTWPLTLRLIVAWSYESEHIFHTVSVFCELFCFEGMVLSMPAGIECGHDSMICTFLCLWHFDSSTKLDFIHKSPQNMPWHVKWHLTQILVHSIWLKFIWKENCSIDCTSKTTHKWAYVHEWQYCQLTPWHTQQDLNTESRKSSVW